MSNIKKIINNAAEGVGEFVKDSAKQVVETVDPSKMIEGVIGAKSPENEFSKYLKDLGGNISQSEIEAKQKQMQEEDKTGIDMAKKIIKQAGLPAHLRPGRPAEPSIFEKQKHEEIKKAQEVEMQKKQKAASFTTPIGRTTGKAKRRPKSADFEAQKNIKVG